MGYGYPSLIWWTLHAIAAHTVGLDDSQRVAADRNLVKVIFGRNATSQDVYTANIAAKFCDRNSKFKFLGETLLRFDYCYKHSRVCL